MHPRSRMPENQQTANFASVKDRKQACRQVDNTVLEQYAFTVGFSKQQSVLSQSVPLNTFECTSGHVQDAQPTLTFTRTTTEPHCRINYYPPTLLKPPPAHTFTPPAYLHATAQICLGFFLIHLLFWFPALPCSSGKLPRVTGLSPLSTHWHLYPFSPPSDSPHKNAFPIYILKDTGEIQNDFAFNIGGDDSGNICRKRSPLVKEDKGIQDKAKEHGQVTKCEAYTIAWGFSQVFLTMKPMRRTCQSNAEFLLFSLSSQQQKILNPPKGLFFL